MKPLATLLSWLLCTAVCMSASAADFYCSSTRAVQLAQLDPDADTSAAAMGTAGGKAARRTRYKVERFDVLQAYSGQPVLVGSTWLTACMLEPHHPDTRAAFGGLIGLNPDASAAMARSTGLVDRGIRITRDMTACITDNAPAVGYSAISIAGQGVRPCF